MKRLVKRLKRFLHPNKAVIFETADARKEKLMSIKKLIEEDVAAGCKSQRIYLTLVDQLDDIIYHLNIKEDLCM